MGTLRWIIGGLIGGAAGIAIWVLIGYFTQYEVGWIAWGIGFLVGLGVRFSAYLGDQEESVGQGLVAATMAFGSIVVAKFILFSIFAGGGIPVDDDTMIMLMATDVVQEMSDRGQKVHWSPGKSLDEASEESDFPPSVWREARNQWEQLETTEQQEQKDQLATLIATLSGESSPGFLDFFSSWDLLWFGLAMFTAFRVGVGAYGDD